MNITLTFEPKTLDYIAQVLAARPYSEVATVLADIQRQVQQQQRADKTPQAIAMPNGATEAQPVQ